MTARDLNRYFGGHLRQLRATKRLGVRELARKVSGVLKGRGLSAGYLSAIEKGVKPPPRPKVLKALAQALQVSPAELEWIAHGWRVDLLSRYLTARPKYRALLTRLTQGKAAHQELLAVLRVMHDETPLRRRKTWILHIDEGSEVLLVTAPPDTRQTGPPSQRPRRVPTCSHATITGRSKRPQW